MKRSIVTTIIKTFVVFGFIPMLFFLWLVNSNVQNMSQKIMDDSLDELTTEKGIVIDLKLEQVENEVKNLARWMAVSLSDPMTLGELQTAERQYQVISKGFITRIQPSNGTQEKTNPILTNVYMPLKTDFSAQIHEIALTGRIDARMVDLHENIPFVEWVYAISKNDQLRIYPYADVATFEADHRFKDDIYFSQVTPERNPDKGTIWTVPYYDWMGKGWVITCSAPVYIGSEFWGIVAVDVPMTAIYSILDDLKISDSGSAFLVDYDGNLIYHPGFVSTMSMKGEPYSVDQLLMDGRPGYNQVLKGIAQNRKGAVTYLNPKTQISKRISYTGIDRISWILAIEVDTLSHYQNSPFARRDFINTIILLILLVSALGIFMIRRVSSPLVELTEQISGLSQDNIGDRLKSESKNEIGALAHAFNQLLGRLKEHTDAILRQNKQMEIIVSSLPGHLFMIDKDFRLITSASEELFGSQNQPEAKCYEVYSLRESVCDNCPVQEALNNHKTTISNIILGRRMFEVTASPLFMEMSEPYFVIYSRDITDKILIEKELSHTAKLAEIGQVVAGITHEMKSPLSVIRGVLYLIRIQLEDAGLDEKKRDELADLLKKISDSVDYSDNTIQNYLDFSKKSNLNDYEQVDLNTIVQQILMLEKHSLIKSKIEYRVSSSEKILVVGDSDTLKHILLNVFSNAVSAMPEGGFLSIGLSSESTALGCDAVIRISDTGCGIPEADISRIFDPFYTTRKDTGGAGLGLWIVMNELKKLNGSIEVRSILGEGTEVTIRVPVDGRSVGVA